MNPVVPKMCNCSFTRDHKKTTCGSDKQFILQCQDRLLDSVNSTLKLSQQWNGVIAKGKEYLARFSNLLLESEQLDPSTFASSLQSEQDALLMNASGKRGTLLLDVQSSLFSLQRKLVSIQQKANDAIRTVEQDIDCCFALNLQRCTKAGLLHPLEPVFKTLTMVDIHRLLQRVHDELRQELMLR